MALYNMGNADVTTLMAIEARGDGAGEAKTSGGKTWQDVYKNSGINTTENKIMSFKPDAPFAKDGSGNSTELIIPYKVGADNDSGRLRIAKKGYRPSNLDTVVTIQGGSTKCLSVSGNELRISDNADMSNYTVLNDKGIHTIYFEMQGGGGSGGSQTDSPNGGGGGGASGAFICGYLPLIEGVKYRLSAGTGGNRPAVNNNTTGGYGASSSILKIDEQTSLFLARGGTEGKSGSGDSRLGGVGGNVKIDASMETYVVASASGCNGGAGGYNSSSNTAKSGDSLNARVITTYAEANRSFTGKSGGAAWGALGGGGGGASLFADGGIGAGGNGSGDISDAGRGQLGSGGGGGDGNIVGLGFQTSHYWGAAGGNGFISIYY
jgi:hypothetical protein